MAILSLMVITLFKNIIIIIIIYQSKHRIIIIPNNKSFVKKNNNQDFSFNDIKRYVSQQIKKYELDKENWRHYSYKAILLFRFVYYFYLFQNKSRIKVYHIFKGFNVRKR